MDQLLADVALHDIEIVLVGRVKNIGVNYRDSDNNPATPEALSLTISDLCGNEVLTDIYLPAINRDPDPPRILNPTIGKYEFPLGLDNGLTPSASNPRKNKTDNRIDYLFTWKASTTTTTKASISIDPSANLNDIIEWTSVPDGTPGNFITIEYIDPAVINSPLTLTRTGSKIVISLATDSIGTIISTANDVITAVIADPDISEIVIAALPTGAIGIGILTAVAQTPLVGGIDASEEVLVCKNVKIINHRMCSLIQKLRLIIDKAIKYVSSGPDDNCYLGYTEGQLTTYLEDGLQIINSYQPSVCFTVDNFPYNCYEFILVEASLIAGVMSQQLFAVDTDIPSWNDQGNAFVIQHQPQLAAFLNTLIARLDKLIPMFKLNFVSSGSLHVQAGPNYRLAQLFNAAPSGSLFRNIYFRGG